MTKSGVGVIVPSAVIRVARGPEHHDRTVCFVGLGQIFHEPGGRAHHYGQHTRRHRIERAGMPYLVMGAGGVYELCAARAPLRHAKSCPVAYQ